jgi:hypothetical protein
MMAILLYPLVPGLGGVVTLSLLAILFGLAVLEESSWSVLSRAYVPDDQQWVYVNGAEPFTRWALALQGGTWVGFA